MKNVLRHCREKNSLNFRYVFGVPVQWSINFKFIVDKHTYIKLYINSPYPILMRTEFQHVFGRQCIDFLYRCSRNMLYRYR